MLKRKLILLLSVIFAIMLSMTAVFSSAYLTDMDKKDSIMLKSAKLKNEIAVKLLQNHIDNTASTAVMACTLKNQSNVDITNSLQLTANFEMTNDAVKYNDKITALYIYPGDMSDSAVVADLNNGASSAYSRTTLDTGKIQITLPEIAVGKDSEKVVNFKIALKGSDLCGYGNVLNIEIDAEAKTKNSGGGYGFTEDLGSNSFILYDNINTADSNNVIVNGTQTIKEVKINGIYSNISTETAPLSNLYQLLPIRNKENVYIKDDTSHYKKYGLTLKNGKLYGTLSTVIDEDATEPVSFCYTSDNKSAGTAYLHFKIDAYDLSSGNIEVSQEEFNDLIYTGAAISPQPTVTNKDINKALVLNDDYTLSYSGNTNAGTATLTIKGKGNYKGEIIKTYNISARDISETTIADIDDYTYTGSAITPLPVVTYNDKTLTNNTDYTLSYSDNTNAGTATITITGKGNYTGTTSTEFTILKADSNVTTAPSANSLTYSGSAQTLTTAGACSGGTLYYRLYSYTNNSSSTTTYSNSYSTTRPTGTAAGTYVVQYYVKGDSNHNDTSVSTVSVTIAKASFTSTVSISGYTYGGTKSTPSVSNNPGNATVTYYGRSTSTGTATNWSSVTSTTYNAGTRYCYAVIAATNNYNSYTTANTSFTISKASFTATVSISGYTYGGTKSTPSISNNPGGGTVTYYGRSTLTGTATNWSNVTSTTYNAGTRYCYAVIAESTNYNSYTTGNTSFTISKADSGVTTAPASNSLTYNGSAQTLVTTGSCSGGTLYYRLYSYKSTTASSATTYSNSYSTTRPTGTNAGTYVVQYYVKGDSNHNDTSVSGVSVTLSPRNFSSATVTLDTTQYIYTGSAITPEPTVKWGTTTLIKDTDYTVSYSNNTNATTSAKVTVTGKGNYSTTSKSVTFTIIKPSGYWTDDGNYATAFAGGTGLSNSPYQINTASQLARMAYLLNTSSTYKTRYFVLTADIDLSAHYWVAAGKNSTNCFAGNFDGGGYKIKNMVTNGINTENDGFFGYVYSTSVKISNIVFDNPIIGGTAHNCGVVCGRSATAINISNIYIYNPTITGTSRPAGGVVGYVAGNSITHTFSNIHIMGGKIISTSASAGGIVGGGSSGGSSYYISEKISNSNIKIDTLKGTSIGGICGNISNAYCTFKNCTVDVLTATGTGRGISASSKSNIIENCVVNQWEGTSSDYILSSVAGSTNNYYDTNRTSTTIISGTTGLEESCVGMSFTASNISTMLNNLGSDFGTDGTNIYYKSDIFTSNAPISLNSVSNNISLATASDKQSAEMPEIQETMTEKISDLSNIIEALPIEDETVTPTPILIPSPSVIPDSSPFVSPSASPGTSPSPSIMPSSSVIPEDTPVPSVEPTPAALPTPLITAAPTSTPTVVPTLPPTAEPIPTVMPTIAPTETPEPSPTPTATVLPTVSPMPVIESSYYAIWDNSLVVKNSVLNKFLHGARGVMPG